MYSILIILVVTQITSVTHWYSGDLHRHTGFSTVDGYPGVANSNCLPSCL